MTELIDQREEILSLLLKQLGIYWNNTDSAIIAEVIPEALKEIETGFAGLPSNRFFANGKVSFSPCFSVHWMIFLYRMAHAIYQKYGSIKEADQVYYLNKIMHSNDWFYAINLPIHFLCEHPLGSVLGRAQYGDYLFVYQGTTIGGSRRKGQLFYPTLGDFVTLYANATVLGDTHIGSNVVISANTYIINETIPDNCIVFGRSPELIIKQKTKEDMKELFECFWGRR